MLLSPTQWLLVYGQWAVLPFVFNQSNFYHSATSELTIDREQFDRFGSPFKFDGDMGQLMTVLDGFDVNTQPLALLRDRLEMECGMVAHYELWDTILGYLSSVAESARLLITATTVPLIRMITN